MRLQLYADVHRNEDLKTAMHIKYVAQVLEKVVFGSLVMEPTEPSADSIPPPDQHPFIADGYALVIPICADPGNTRITIRITGTTATIRIPRT